jgi:hypothetical protein
MPLRGALRLVVSLRVAVVVAVLMVVAASAVAWLEADRDPALLARRAGDSFLKYGLYGHAAACHLAAARVHEAAAAEAEQRSPGFLGATQAAADEYVRAGDVLLSASETEAARALYTSALGAAAWYGLARARLAEVDVARNDPTALRRLADLAFRCNNSVAQAALARALAARGQSADAGPLLAHAAAAGSSTPGFQLAVAETALAAGDGNLAVTAASGALASAGSLREAWRAGRVLAGAGASAGPWTTYAGLALRDYGVSVGALLLYCLLLVTPGVAAGLRRERATASLRASMDLAD